jgi:tape measure domain-containing protein
MARIDVGLLFTARERITGPLRRINQALKKTEAQARKTRKGLRSIDLVIGLMVAGSLTALVKKFGEMGAEMEGLRVRIGVFERGMGNVDNIMTEMNEQFGKTPFSLKVIGDSFVRLKASGLDPLDGSLKALLDGVAAFGGGTDELQRAGIAIQQIAGKGVVSMEELRQQLGEAIPFAMRIMAQQMQISVGELISQIERGEVEANRGLTALFEGLEKTFGGVSDAMVNTMSGAFARLVKVIQGAADKIFNSFKLGPTIAATINVISDMIENMTAALTQEDVDKFKQFFIQTAFLAFRVVVILLKLADVIASVLMPVVDAFNGVLDDIALVLTVIDEKLSGTGRSLEEIVTDFNNSNKSVDGFAKNVEKLAEKGLAALNKALENTQPLIDTLSLNKVNLQRMKQVQDGIEGVAASLAAADTLPFVQKIERLRNKMREFDMGLDQERERLAGLRKSLAEAFAAGDASEDEIVSLITKIETLTQAIAEGDKVARTFGGDIAALEGKLQANFLDKVADRVDKLTLKIADMNAEATGSEFDQAITDIQRKFGSIRVDLEKQRETTMRTRLETEKRAEILAQIEAAILQNNNAEREALRTASRLNDAKMVTLSLTEKQFQAQQRFAQESRLQDLQRLESPLANIFQSDVVDRAREQRRQVQAQIEDTRVQIAQLNEQSILEKDPERKAAIEARIVTLQQTLPLLDQIREKTTATALLSQQLWSAVGETLRTSLTDALVGLVDGTKTLQDVATSAFQRITQAAADYLVQLLLIKAASGFAGFGGGAAAGGAGGAGGAGFGGLLAGLFARGGVFKGNVKPFANGDIVRGPTLFGLAGEAGTEAIMPLTRRNGRLGVEGGGGGDTLNVNIQSLDARQASEIIIETLPEIESARRQGKALNEGNR